MSALTKTDKRTLAIVARSHFTFIGDSQFRTYAQAKRTLARLERAGLLKREEHDSNMFVLTPAGRESAP